MKVYRLRMWSKELIQELEAEKWTDKTLTINGNRKAWQSHYSKYYKSWDEAYNQLHLEASKKLANCASELELAREKLTEIQKYKDINQK